MKLRTWKILSAALAGILLILACGNPYNGPVTQTPLPTYTQPADAVTTTPTALLSVLPSATLSVGTSVTPNGTQIAAGTPAEEWINDAYGGRAPEKPDAPLTEPPNIFQPLSGHTYEPRPVYVFTDAPSCSGTIAQGQICGVWATTDQAWVDGYLTEWQPSMPQRSVQPFNGGTQFIYDHEDASFYFMADVNNGLKFTFSKASAILSPPATNAQLTLTTDSGPVVRPVHYWLANVYAPWGPHATKGTSGLDLLTANTWTTVYSWGIDAQYSLWWACDDAGTASQSRIEPDYGKCFQVAKPDFLPYKFLGRVPDAGGWFQSTDGQILYATWEISEYFRDGFWFRTTGNTTYPY